MVFQLFGPSLYHNVLYKFICRMTCVFSFEVKCTVNQIQCVTYIRWSLYDITNCIYSAFNAICKVSYIWSCPIVHQIQIVTCFVNLTYGKLIDIVGFLYLSCIIVLRHLVQMNVYYERLTTASTIFQYILLPQEEVMVIDLAILLRPFCFLAPKYIF